MYGVVKGASECLGLQSLGSDLGIELNIHLRTDSSAAVGICSRTGIGKIRHLATGQLWIQERIRSGALRLYKYPGNDNPGDICTKHVPSEVLCRHVPAVNLQEETGRAESAPNVTENRGK